MRNEGKRTNRLLIAALTVMAWHSTGAIESVFEVAADLTADEFLPADLLQGRHHRVEDAVRSDGYLNYYRIQSEFGVFEAVSTAMLRTRIGEIQALAALDTLSKTEVFARAATEAGVKQLRTVKEFATRPIETVKGIPGGVGRMFTRYTRQASEAVEAAQVFVAGDEAGGGGDTGDGESTSDKAIELTESYFGVGKAQRAWARKLGTDPYSNNEVLQAAIKEVAWAERLGKFGMGFAGVPKIPGADIIGDVNEAVWSKDPYELKDLNRARLSATGASEELIEIYLESHRMTPSQQTLLTAAIAELGGVTGRDGILRQSLRLDGETEINFFIKSVTMLAWYHLNEMPLHAVKTYAAVPVGVSEDGNTVMLFAVDHLYWTESIAAAARNHAHRASRQAEAEVWLLGTASQRCKSELVALGLSVYEDVAARMADES
jgi:hypothetical protein